MWHYHETKIANTTIMIIANMIDFDHNDYHIHTDCSSPCIHQSSSSSTLSYSENISDDKPKNSRGS